MNFTKCLIYWDDPLVTQVAMSHHGTFREKQTNRIVCVGLFCPKTAQKFASYRPDFFFQSTWVFRGVTPVCNSNLKTYRTDYESGVGKRSHSGLTLLDDIDSSTKRFSEILSKVLVARERSLSFKYGRPDESFSSFTLMYFGKRGQAE